jgi:hypothetical protein
MSRKWSERCLERGRSILLAAIDSKGFPSCCRGIAVNSTDDFATLTAYVPVATSQDVVANIAATRKLAVSSTQPLDHNSVQLKGTATNVRLARDDERQFVEEKLLEFADVLAECGLPRRITRAVTHWPAFAVEMKVEQVFEQTPGPKAGTVMP